MKKLLLFLLSEDGPTSVEYAVMLAMIIAVCFSSILLLGEATSDSYDISMERIADAVAAGS